MKIAALFAGIGGLELGLHEAGHETLLTCEIWDPAVSVLAAQFPHTPNRLDVTDLKSLPAIKIEKLKIEAACAKAQTARGNILDYLAQAQLWNILNTTRPITSLAFN